MLIEGVGRPGERTAPAGRKSDRRILVVDDDKLLLATLRKRLEHAGFDVFTARDGEEGIRLIRHHRFDVVILDVMLPGIDGFDLCRRLKSRPAGDRPRVVMLSAVAHGTGKSDEEMRERSGADAFFSKPCRFSDLLHAIEASG